MNKTFSPYTFENGKLTMNEKIAEIERIKKIPEKKKK